VVYKTECGCSIQNSDKHKLGKEQQVWTGATLLSDAASRAISINARMECVSSRYNSDSGNRGDAMFKKLGCPKSPLSVQSGSPYRPVAHMEGG